MKISVQLLHLEDYISAIRFRRRIFYLCHGQARSLFVANPISLSHYDNVLRSISSPTSNIHQFLRSPVT